MSVWIFWFSLDFLRLLWLLLLSLLLAKPLSLPYSPLAFLLDGKWIYEEMMVLRFPHDNEHSVKFPL